jgi:hypothetical protein
MNRKITCLIGVIVASVGLGSGILGFALGARMVTCEWRRQLPELGKIISRKNAGGVLETQHWPSDIDLVPARVEGEILTVYMGTAADTNVDLVFEKERLVALRARE